ncbi:hypothetical protein I5Q34_32925 [Streptomyces sp. AV19]|uniref:hypothetical protein n=1 Tax=Streptomyces sp. AV19 TaxID=2793068 RepID=UPI0018FF0BF9|nr:hypothetical protein [Streptomyces sp. AV19]MBH1939008.1 hypothetical protein [Streptomyces sp. AV19]MDG4531611.1 hypothetical protein [Streptomyces sp. AV19]
MGVDVEMNGPLFDGRAARAAAAFCDAAREEIAEYAETLVLNELGHVLRHPTGYYESRVETERLAADTSRVHDNGVVYGPWLEGIGSRNAPVTRFAGYSHWRRMKEAVKGQVPAMAERILQRHLPGMR